MFYQIFFSPQVKRCAIVTYKHGIYDLAHELPIDFRLKTWELANLSSRFDEFLQKRALVQSEVEV